jgi:hypothetical protein
MPLLVLLALGNLLHAQEVEENPIKKLFLSQISLFPQEKIYVHTDRSNYVAGETIWLRAHLVDAIFLKQANASRYVYVELVNPVSQLVERVKLRSDSTGCFYGQIRLEEELCDGNYLLRAYTRFMQNVGEDYFFSKPISITNQLSDRVFFDIKYSDVGNNATKADIRLRSKTGKEKIESAQCLIFSDGNDSGSGKEIDFKNNAGYYTFKEKEIGKNRVFLLKATTTRGILKKYFTIPYTEKTFDVTFFPEGGYAPVAANLTMGFKSINVNGLSEDIKGQIFDDQNQLCTEFESTHLGMGSFNMYYAPGKKYYAVCTNNENVSKRFDLPVPSDRAISLKTVWTDQNKLYVSVLRSPGCKLPPQTQLIAHIRGVPVFVQPWDDNKEYLIFEKNFFPAGIVHFLLIDSDRNILSERLVFSDQRSTFANANIELDKASYQTRGNVNMAIHVMDENKIPLKGNFSMAVVDANATTVDTTSNIVSALLLTSELKGYIEQPMSYMQRDNKKSTIALDNLMMTQGWRRYDIPNLLKGNPTQELKFPVELSESVSGTAEGVFSALKEGNISLLALKDSIIGTSFAKPDNAGKFIFKDLEYPEGTKYIIQANTKKGSKQVFLEMDSLNVIPALPAYFKPTREKLVANDTVQLVKNKKYIADDGLRMYNLNELLVTGQRKPAVASESPYYSINSSSVVTAKDIDEWHLISVYDLLRRIPGVTISGSEVKFRGSTPMLVLDNIPTEAFDYNMLTVDDIQEAFVSDGITMGVIFGSRGANGAIVINTKKGFIQRNKINTNIKYVNSLGYQQPAQFYSPVYKTKEEINNGIPDYRTTIFWNPNVLTGTDGTAKLSFYTADSPSKYIVVLEGVSQQGHLIHLLSEIPVVSK